MSQDMKCCDFCGQPKPLSEFSKSYKNRCKECVATLTRAKRAGQHSNGKSAEFLIVDDPIDWKQRKYEIAKGLMPEMARQHPGDYRRAAKDAVLYAEILIDALKSRP